MRINVKIGTLVAIGAVAVAVPAAAKPGNAQHPRGANHPSRSHKCKPRNTAYVESGTVDTAAASTLAANSDGTWSGTLVVDVSKANHAAKRDKATTVTYTFSNAKLKVRFDGGASGFGASERIKLIGKLAAVGKRCAPLDPVPTPVFRMVVVHPATS
jgi:hypothetical protein